jgi:predicted N-acetyltransferase YhbS
VGGIVRRAGMSAIRPMRDEDLPAVAQLVAGGFPGFAAQSRPSQLAFLAATLRDQPWADSELPSLVAADDQDRVIGFVGCHARRLRLGDRAVRAACCSHLIVDPAHPPGALGARLLARFMAGPQELSYSDTANTIVARIWGLSGGHVDQLRRVTWMRVLRPRAWALRTAAATLAGPRAAERLLPVPALPRHLAPPELASEGVVTEPLTPQVLVDHLDALGRVGLRLDYDLAFVEWLFGMLDGRHRKGKVLRRLVRRRDRAIGWFVVALSPSGRADVLQVASAARDAQDVLGAAMGEARAAGALVLAGRVEPHLADAVRRAGAVMSFGPRPIAHAHDSTLLAELASERSLLTLLDGEWW